MTTGSPRAGGPPGPAIEIDEQRAADFSSLFRLDGRRVIVVGGYGGIGEVTTRLFSEYGADVMIAGRSEDKAAALAAELSSDGGRRAIGCRVDIADRASARALVRRCVEELGGLDVLVNLAGIDLEAPAEGFDEQDWESVMRINLSGAFWLSQAAGEVMINARRGGRIIHYSTTRSVAGGRRGFAAYAASKAGLNGLIRQLSTEWGKYRIAVNGVAPGFVPTELVADAAMDQRFVSMMLGRIPFGRFGEPVELAAATLFLASPGSSFITGQVIFVDGGVTASSYMDGNGDDKPRIAYIGLGVMGAGMACRLAESGYDVAVYNRTRSKAEEAGKLGARIADSPADAARAADVVMLSLANQDVVARMLFGEGGVFETLKEGGYILDMSTVPPDFPRALAQRAREQGYRALDACVLGNPFHARQGELRVMAGGAEEDFRAVEGLLRAIGKDVSYLGESGMGATMKLVLNMLMGVQMTSLAEAIVLGERAGLEREQILDLISNSGYSSPMMSFRCAIMGQRNFEFAAFKLGLMRKDMTLVLSESQRLGVPMPVTESAYTMLTAAQQQGLGDLDVAAILAFQERMTGMDAYAWPGQDETPGDDAASGADT